MIALRARGYHRHECPDNHDERDGARQRRMHREESVGQCTELFHNKLVDYMRALRVPRAAVFESARRLARWHYQWMVTHDFLPAIVGKAMADSVYKEVLTGVPIINIKYYKPTNPLGRPFIPVEFAVAAYRFGHSITRPRYTVQDYVNSTGATVAVKSVPLFEAQPTDNNLNGSRPLPARLKIQWSKFFNAAGETPPPGPCDSSTLRWPARCSSCPRRCCPTRTRSSLLRSGTSSGAGRWACPRDSRWLG